MHSAVLIIPATLRQQADDVAAAMGWGPLSFTVPLALLGNEDETPSHWACRADVTLGFLRQVRGLDPLSDLDHAPVFDALSADFRPDPTLAGDDRSLLWGRHHFDAVLDDQGFCVVAE
ncbi:MAG: hypothetical protein K8F59_10945 [Rhodobacteraceae bacterium]|nr:hypothetical protein [Paracoccaceae bacterium]